MHLTPKKNDTGEFRFILSGESDVRAPQTIIAANALYEAGYPVEVSGIVRIIEWIEGNDYISVVPMYESIFYGDCIHLSKGKASTAVAKKTDWKFCEYKMMETV